jgi:hypothetical protein
MAIHPNIAMGIQQVTTQSPSQVLDIFQTNLNQAQNRRANQQVIDQRDITNPLQAQLLQEQVSRAPIQSQLLQQQQAAGEQQQSVDIENRTIRAASEFGTQVKPVLESGNIEQAQAMFTSHIADLKAKGLPTQGAEQIMQQLAGGNSQGVLSALDSMQTIARQRGLLQGGQGQKQFALQSNAPITDPTTGQVSTPVFDPASGQTRLVPIEGAIKETPTQEAAREFKSAQSLSELNISETKAKETIKARVARTSALKKEFSERRRLAARSTRKVKEAQKLAQNATQGVAGSGKLALARLFPGIDASDEGALSSAFKSLALDELQKFKGPTTDFEFAVTEDISGSLGNSASANTARLASLERANWFADRESQQFNDHVKGGHDPDEFFFNFSELVTPKKGGKSYPLQSLQDTAVANHISIDEVIKRLSK